MDEGVKKTTDEMDKAVFNALSGGSQILDAVDIDSLGLPNEVIILFRELFVDVIRERNKMGFKEFLEYIKRRGWWGRVLEAYDCLVKSRHVVTLSRPGIRQQRNPASTNQRVDNFDHETPLLNSP